MLTENALEIRNLTKNYKEFSLQNLNLTLPSGCIMGLIGENGAGKSTAIRLILDMIRRDAGEILILGQDNRKHPEILREDLGIVLDDTGFSGCLTPKQINHIMKNSFRNWDENYFRGFLKKLSVPDHKQFKELSKGMKMKLFIAVAMSHHPKFLILDEATNGLDPLVRDEITDLFLEFTRDETHSVLISSHIVSDLEKICDYIAFLHKGQLMLCEEKDILREKYGIVHCNPDQLRVFPENAVKGKRITKYDAELLIEREHIPNGFPVSPVSIEELFVFMAKEET
ncbi:MAG: ABC transporter ATP-binding protein [Oscillospiraceae bacterium]|nr:ABC transporter ATP-binding protein [Oscillospiraceae bacterium]